ncbi:MAG TPA: MEDS domain-containing protein [Candidatus Eremiobacteraceae bacterium]
MSRKVTIKELAVRLNVSVPTLRKYGECGLLDVDSVAGRTNLFDEEGAVSRVDEINRLKSKGYSLSLIREKIDTRPTGFAPLDLGIAGAHVSHGRHVLFVVQDLDEYHAFARDFIVNALRAEQAVMLVVHPDHREPLEHLVVASGFNLAELEKSRQLTFTWYDGPPANMNAKDQVEAFHDRVTGILSAGWQSLRLLGHPHIDPASVEESVLEAYETRITQWAAKLPIIVVCVWMATNGNADILLRMQRHHREFVHRESVFFRAS